MSEGPIYRPVMDGRDGPPPWGWRRPRWRPPVFPADEGGPPPWRRLPMPRHPILVRQPPIVLPRTTVVVSRPVVHESRPAFLAVRPKTFPLAARARLPAAAPRLPRAPAIALAAGTFVPDEVLLELRPGQPADALASLAARYRLQILRSDRIDLLDTTVVRARLARGDRAPRLVGALAADPRVAAAQLNEKYKLQAEASASAPAGGASPSAQWSAVRMHLAEVHKITSGEKVIVAIVDSGVDLSHPELAGDDVVVVNVLDTSFSPHEHGTAVAGALASRGQLSGVAPASRLIAIRAFDSAASDMGAEGTTDFIVKALAVADGEKARIVNLSFAGPADPLLSRMLAALRRKGVIVMAAAGNAGPNSPPLYPAASPDVIAVTATDANDGLYALANRGPYIHLAAPGVDILEPAPGASYQLTSGTSIATAHMTGIAALLVARDPRIDPAALTKLLTETAAPASSRVGGGNRGVDVVDVMRAVQQTTIDAPPGKTASDPASAP